LGKDEGKKRLTQPQTFPQARKAAAELGWKHTKNHPIKGAKGPVLKKEITI